MHVMQVHLKDFYINNSRLKPPGFFWYWNFDIRTTFFDIRARMGWITFFDINSGWEIESKWPPTNNEATSDHLQKKLVWLFVLIIKPTLKRNQLKAIFLEKCWTGKWVLRQWCVMISNHLIIAMKHFSLYHFKRTMKPSFKTATVGMFDSILFDNSTLIMFDDWNVSFLRKKSLWLG